ncbi:MAG: hypothetical protein AAFV98_10365 [Chloroflexota bacterium]
MMTFGYRLYTLHKPQWQAVSSAFPMHYTDNSIFLSYRQDVARRLTTMLYDALVYMSVDVFMDKSHFLPTDLPSQAILDEIANRDFYVLILTPLSYLQHHRRTMREINHARKTGSQIVVICAYGLFASARNIPTDSITIELLHLDVGAVIAELADLIEVMKPKITWSQVQINQLHAEWELNCGFSRLGPYRFEGAKPHIEFAINIDPSFADAYYHLAVRLREDARKALPDQNSVLIELHKAEAYSTFAINLKPTEARYYAERGQTRYKVGIRFNAENRELILNLAITDISRAISLAPQCAEYYVERAFVYSTLGMTDNALADYDRALEIHPDNREYHMYRGNLHASLGNYRQAIADKLVWANDWSSYAYVDIGFYYWVLGEKDSAYEVWERAKEKGSRFHFYYHRAKGFIKRGELELARDDIREMYMLKPNAEMTKGVIHRLAKAQAQSRFA